jgi:hypothetical protein
MDRSRASYRVDLNAKPFSTQRKEAWDAAVSDYPDLRDPTSVFSKTAERLALAARDPNHPDHPITSSGELPRFFADRAAWELGRPVIRSGVVVEPAEAIPGIPRFAGASGQHEVATRPEPEPTLNEAWFQFVRAIKAVLLAFFRLHRR